MTNVALAFLEMLDGEPRQTCVGCSTFLLERGMLEIAGQVPLKQDTPSEQMICRIYRIRYPFTLEGCRRAIKDRHVGRPWGE